jgi:hypothetical protein
VGLVTEAALLNTVMDAVLPSRGSEVVMLTVTSSFCLQCWG